MAQAPGRYAPGSGTDLKAQKGLRDMNGSLRRMDSAMHAELNELRRNAQQNAAYQSGYTPGAKRMADTPGFNSTLDERARAAIAEARGNDALDANKAMDQRSAAQKAASAEVESAAQKAAGAAGKSPAGRLRLPAAVTTAGKVLTAVGKASVPLEMLLHADTLGNSDLYKDPSKIPGARKATPEELAQFNGAGTLRVGAALPPKPTAAAAPAAAQAQSADDANRIARNAVMLAEFDAKEAAGAPRSARDVVAQDYATSAGNVHEVAPGILRVNRPGASPIFTNVAGGNRLPGAGESEQPGTLRAYVDVVERQAQAAEAAGKGADARRLRTEGALAAMQEQGTNARFDKDIDARTQAAKYTRDTTLAKNQFDMTVEQGKVVAERNKALLDQMKAQHGDEAGAARYAAAQTTLQGVRARAANAMQAGSISPDSVFYQMFGGEGGQPLPIDRLTAPQKETMALLASDSPLGQNLGGIDPLTLEYILAYTDANERNREVGQLQDSAGIGLSAGALGAGAGFKMGGLRGAIIGGAGGLALGAANQLLGSNPYHALDQNNLDATSTKNRLRPLNGY